MDEKRDTLDTLISDLEHVLTTDNFDSLESLTSSLTIRDFDSSFSDLTVDFQKRWAQLSVRGCLSKCKKASRLLKQGKKDKAKSAVVFGLLWLKQAKEIRDKVDFFKHVLRKQSAKFLIQPEQLSKGDIILSYKTSYFLKKSFVSRVVAFATNSPITHAMIACHNEGEAPKFLVSGDKTKGLGLIGTETSPGEIFIIMSLKSEADRKKLVESIDLWHDHATRRYSSAFIHEQEKWKFAEAKCQAASFIGLFYVLSSKLKTTPWCFPNPIKNDKKIFCSELIDTIFKGADLLISPRSEHDAVVGPIEIFYSPLLSVKGIIAKDEDMKNTESEIQDQFFDK